jgi:MFS family permease
MTDRSSLYAAAAIRSLAVGFTAVFLGIHLGRLGLSKQAMGAVVGAGLAGGATAALAATLAADRLGRRRFLLALAALGALGAAAAAFLSGPVTLALAAFVGMLNGMGRDRGAALVLEQAVLPATVPDARRTKAFAVYNLVQDAGHALGSLLGGLPPLLARAAGAAPDSEGRVSLLLVALLSAASLPLYAGLSGHVEPEGPTARAAVSPATRGVLARISSLFAVDAFGSGLIPTALLSFFFFERFGASPVTISVLFFAARALNAASHLAAAWLARRIGLVNTMVFTHLPSSLLLATVGIAPTFGVAAALFLLREGLVEMDVPTRQSYVMALVAPADRTFASGVTNLVRLAAWAVAPAVAGLLMRRSLALPLAVGAALKIAYDLALFGAFRRVRPPEER